VVFRVILKWEQARGGKRRRRRILANFLENIIKAYVI
jgi:hypothetical protein